MSFTAGTTYRNVHMMDVDFHVTRVTETTLIGWWVMRATGAMLSWDELKLEMIHPEFWSPVKEGSGK